jgi:hypothetical protein
MEESYYVGAYWLARDETVDACARRAETFFQGLSACDSSLTHWFKKGRTLEEALQHRIELHRDAFLGVFGPEEKRSPEMGVSLGLWTGESSGGGSSLSLSCGSASVWGSNYCVFDPAPQGSASARLLQASVLKQVLHAMAVAWEPEWGVATSNLLRKTLSDSAEAGTFVGWVTYVSRRRGEVPPLPAPVRVEPVEDKGTLILLTPERFSTSHPAHLELAHGVTETLARAGLLGPLRPWEG